MATEEQCHLFTLLCILSYNELHYLTNLLFFIKKRSTDLAQKHMPHMTFTSVSHDTAGEAFVFESDKRTGDRRITASV